MKSVFKSLLFTSIACLFLLGARQAHGQTPVIFFTDITSGPATGGESVSGYSGAYVTIYGNYFGASQGTSSVTLNGSKCLRVVSWGTPWMWYQKTVVQLGSSCSSGNLVVNTSSGASNGQPFAVRSGNIYCISTSGSDSATGKFPSSCWATMANAANNMNAGDITYLENGVSNTAATAYSAVVNITGNPGGTSSSPIAFVGYPGATATIGDINNSTYAIRVPQIGDSPAYYVLAGLTVRGQVALDAIYSDHWYLIGNDFSCSGSGGFGCVHIDQSTNVFVYGNNLHDVGYSCSSNSGNPTGAPCKFHGFYFTTNTNHVQMAWNTVNMNPANNTNAGCYGIQFYSTGGADQYDLHVHDNTIKNVVCGGINFSTVSTNSGPVEAYNNVLNHVGTGPDPSGSASGYFCLTASSSGGSTTPVKMYNNSLYDCGSRGNVDNSNGGFEIGIPTTLTNNVFQSTGSNEQYIINGSSSSTCSLVSGSNNDWYGNGAPQCSSNLTGNLNVNPLFVSTDAGAVNLALQSKSTIATAGTTIASLTTDVTGLHRPQGSGYAIGAYEYYTGKSVALTCDLNGDGVVNAADVQIAANQAIGTAACTTADLTETGVCSVVDVQRVFNASIGQPCKIGP